MNKTKFTPSIASFFVLLLLVILIGLGTWQVKRLYQKVDLNNRLQAASQMARIDLPLGLEDKVEELKYRTVLMRGKLMNDKEMFLYTGPIESSGKAGYMIITPFAIDDGRFILVNRGWIPMDKKDPATRPETIDKRILLIQGTLIPSETAKTFTPSNDLEKNMWYYLNINEMAKFVNLNLEPMVFVMHKTEDKSELPIIKPVNTELRNNHLQYALIWYGSAIALIVIYFVNHRKNRKNGK